MSGAAASEAQHLARVERLSASAGERDLDLLLVSDPVNVRYLSGFTGSNGIVVIGPPGAGERAGQRFLTDFRYAEQSAVQVPAAFEREVAPIDLLEALAGLLEASGGRLGFDDAAMTVRQHARLREALSEDWELVASAGLVEELRAVKDRAEQGQIRAAAELADEALRVVLERGLTGRTEREVAIELELEMRRLGAQAASFPSIVAAGEHSSRPHAEPREVEIEPDMLVTIDWGAELEGYCSDCTRTFATGSLTDEQRAIYELVLEAQEAALAAVGPGISGRDLDAVARTIIESAGHGEHFGHGLGHGVGMEVHEAPRLSRQSGQALLERGNVVTIEPGVYLPGRFGVRIEDLVLVDEDGGVAVTAISKELTEIG